MPFKPQSTRLRAFPSRTLSKKDLKGGVTMSKPIVFIDAGYLISLSQLGEIGGAILDKISTNYEIHTTSPVLRELGTLSLSVQSWVNNAGTRLSSFNAAPLISPS